jgi:hypothetical protein
VRPECPLRAWRTRRISRHCKRADRSAIHISPRGVAAAACSAEERGKKEKEKNQGGRVYSIFEMADLPELSESVRSRSRTAGGQLAFTGSVAARGDTPPPGFARDLGLKLPGIANTNKKVRALPFFPRTSLGRALLSFHFTCSSW